MDTLYGSFIDQRYIDYLSNNEEDICKMHWRKFEALTCEWFDKNGFYVEIGKGRKDGGIDAKKIRDARGYNIYFVENSNIREWLQNMRTTDKEFIV